MKLDIVLSLEYYLVASVLSSRPFSQRKPGPFKDVGSIAFVSDPDGYWVELIQRGTD